MTKRPLGLCALIAVLTIPVSVRAIDEEDSKKGKDKDKPVSVKPLASLKFRSIGPALMSGRICDFAVDPNRPSHYFAAACSGGVWKTNNAGTTWKPIFDKQKSYSVGCVTMDANNSNVIWVGSGENNSQRSVSFGDGIYLSRDGGSSWKNMGLKESEHIGMIVIDPRDSDTVYAAAQGPLWNSGGDRGLYKTTNGGKTWQRILHISDDTGVNEVHMDPRDPDVLYASAYQRRRRVWTLINGGPESGVYKSTDAGKTWRKINKGLPGGDKGRIGLCISPANPDVVYAVAEASGSSGGFFRSTNRGETWSKRSSYMSSSPQYYNEIVCDPLKVDRVYALDTRLQVTEDGGANFNSVPGRGRHVDDHALWIDPDDTDHLLIGCDGGIYESYDRGAAWEFKPNLPISQFYRVEVDNSEPFYFVYGGTQDNNTVGGPSRTLSPAGILNEDWFVTVGGDGFVTRVDPEDPNIVYSQWQYGGLIRHDRRSGQVDDIKPREPAGGEAYKWNWDSPMIISSHNHNRLYFGGNKLFRSEDQGHSWTVISDDLSRGLDRDQLEVMGKIQNVDAVSKNRSTSIYGTAVSLSESPMVEGLIYVGTDDGLIHVTEDDGETWRKVGLFPGVPDTTYVSYLTASRHDADTVFAAFDNHKSGDFKPYVLKSTDRGETWTSVAGDLPDRDTVYAVVEDHVDSNLLFAGTEFGVFFSVNGGEEWMKLKSGVPTIAVRDIAIQERENDLVLGTFGRGFYVLDDYTPLRSENRDLLKADAAIFPVKDALLYMQTSRLGGGGRGSQGAHFYAASNPPYGATFTYHIKKKLTTRKERRKEAEKKSGKAGKKGKSKSKYPTIDELRAEDDETTPSVFLTVRDDVGEVVRRITGSRNKGVHRATWNLRYASLGPAVAGGGGGGGRRFRGGSSGPYALPGTYTVTISKQVDGVVTEITEPVSFEVVPLGLGTFEAEDRAAVLAFQKKVGRLQRAVQGASRAAREAGTRVASIEVALPRTPAADPGMIKEVHDLEQRLNEINVTLNGDSTRRRRQEASPPSISQRVSQAVQWSVTSAPSQTQQDAYRLAGEAFTDLLADLRDLMENDLAALEKKLEEAGGPWTPGRLPDWTIE